MRDIALTLAEELRFLGLQCMAQARGSHRDQDRAFIDNLLARLFEIAPNLSLIYARLLIPAAEFELANLRALILSAGRDLDLLADDLDQHMSGRAA
ncbi:MAG: hypothetical protein J0L51_07265 [Rhizobiales bacterium]|nr:hypothetical protein [Hyphomicrobiales bacterium]